MRSMIAGADEVSHPTVVLDSSEQAGTTFTIDIPVDAREFDGG